MFTKNRGHRIITFEQAHEQAEHHHPQPPADTPVIEQATARRRLGAVGHSCRPATSSAEQVPAGGPGDRLTPWSAIVVSLAIVGAGLWLAVGQAPRDMAAFGWLLVVAGVGVPGREPLPAPPGLRHARAAAADGPRSCCGDIVS